MILAYKFSLVQWTIYFANFISEDNLYYLGLIYKMVDL